MNKFVKGGGAGNITVSCPPPPLLQIYAKCILYLDALKVGGKSATLPSLTQPALKVAGKSATLPSLTQPALKVAGKSAYPTQ